MRTINLFKYFLFSAEKESPYLWRSNPVHNMWKVCIAQSSLLLIPSGQTPRNRFVYLFRFWVYSGDTRSWPTRSRCLRARTKLVRNREQVCNTCINVQRVRPWMCSLWCPQKHGFEWWDTVEDFVPHFWPSPGLNSKTYSHSTQLQVIRRAFYLTIHGWRSWLEPWVDNDRLKKYNNWNISTFISLINLILCLYRGSKTSQIIWSCYYSKGPLSSWF